MHFIHPENIALSRFAFEDVDQFADWERQLGLDLEGVQLSCGGNKIMFDYFAHPDITLARFSAKRAMQNHFKLPDGIVMIAICRTSQPVLWRGRHVTRHMLIVLRSSQEQWVVLPEGWDCTEVFVTEEMIRRTELFPPGYFAETENPEKAYIPLSDTQAAQLLRVADSCFHRSFVQSSWFIDRIMEILQQTIDAGLQISGSVELRTSRRPDLVTRGRDFVLANLQSDITADDLAVSLGVSYRVLNYAFRDTLGISPFRYIQTERLHALRRLLKQSDSSIADAGYRFGFYSPGRLTAQYNRLFGERPSETLLRTRS